MEVPDPILGRADRRDWVRFQVKGNLVAARPRYVRETWGDAGYADVLGRLAGEAKAAFEGRVLPFAWVPFPTMAEVDRAIVTGPMQGQVGHMKAFGATIARYDLSTLYKMLFKVGSPSFILKRINIAASTYVRGGEIDPVSVEKGRALIAAAGAYPYYFCDQGVAGWLTAAIELSGGTGVEVTHARCIHRSDPRCEWTCRWA